MRGSVVDSIKKTLVLSFFGVFCVAATASSSVYALVDSAGTNIDVAVCAPSSTIVLMSPVNDSVVTQPIVPISGTVTQANQIEVYIDGIFDSIIPLTPSQTSFNDSVQLAPGTHTIKVVAVDACAAMNGTTQVVVTYEAPSPQIPEPDESTGSSTSTHVDGVRIGGEPVEEAPKNPTQSMPVLAPIGLILEWLNIRIVDTADVQGLSLWRAILIGAGLYLLIVGVAVVVLRWLISIPALATLIPATQTNQRIRWLSILFRLLGLLLVLAALFLG